MKIAKRVFLFVAVNILIVSTLSITLSLLGVQPYLTAQGLNLTSLALFCLVWGFGGAFISLALSRWMAKKLMGVEVIDPHSETNSQKMDLLQRVHSLARRAGLSTMPEVGIYASPELNAFATGPSKNRSLVAVSSGLMNSMNREELEGVLAHEVAHIANGDMVTMTILQGIVNSLVMFLARILAYAASQFVAEEKRSMVNFAVVIVSEILLGILGMMVVAAFSRAREFRADSGGASLSNRQSMIAALQALKRNSRMELPESSAALSSFKISGKSGGLMRLFSTHPDLDLRIEALSR